MTQRQRDDGETRFDFQQMLKDVESEGVRPVVKDVRQTDIAQLFKKKGGSAPDDKPQ